MATKTKEQTAAEKAKADAKKKAQDEKKKNALTADQKTLKNDLSRYSTIFEQSPLNIKLDRLSEGMSPEFDSALQMMKDHLGVSDEEAAQLRNLQQAQARTAETQSILDMMKGGLAGISAEENTALRENAKAATDSAFQTAIGNIQRQAAGRRNIFTSAALAKANQDFTKTRAIQENDLAVKNLDIQDQRRNAYASTLGQAEEREAQRRGDYTNALTSSDTLQANKLSNYTGALQNKENLINQIRQFNAGQGSNEAAARAEGIVNLLNMQYNKNLGQQQIDIAKQGLARTGTSRGYARTNNNSSTTSTNANDALTARQKAQQDLLDSINAAQNGGK